MHLPYKVVYNIPESTIEEFTSDGRPIADEDMLSVGIQQYQYNNFRRIFDVDIEEIAANGSIRTVATSSLDVLEEYLSEHQLMDREIDGRLTLIR